MMQKEFEELAGYEVSTETYNNVIEPMYMATNVTKQEFVKMLNKKAFALPTKAEMKREMRKIAGEIFNGCGLRAYHEEEEKLMKVAREYAKQFYGMEDGGENYVLITHDYAYCGIPQKRGCTYPDELILIRRGYELERIALVG